ncbi:TetR/AcrR family transcriptional regulator [Nonomuraea basaltis]|uniref:TetR/AcrR family transcriptional regulator n=1 Tax=Nonomuraea basaltis TaxID=2495887 RepID=UPI00110C549F|nr:helix-turn-helix domain-containing protein [Nonomuraea basaltis]TMR94900.1 helix-turn-helix transcriptional regulator [Nonomuraea basaltis]
MRAEATGTTGRGRPADPDIEQRVLSAALTVYGEVGWAGFALDAVAGRAPVGKAALYRRWPTKEALLLAAFEHLAEPPEPDGVPAGLRECLINIAGQVVDMFVGPKAMVLPRILIEAARYPRTSMKWCRTSSGPASAPAGRSSRPHSTTVTSQRTPHPI